ncbi:MAG: hypothetical protein IK060_03935 [Methanomicrobium sp.]|nr:hypothetical protein [Methanomicrobium sp.]
MAKQGNTKKDKTDMQKTLSRAFIIFILISCVLGFSLTFSFFSIFKAAEAGNYVALDYTIYYAEGLPILTTSSNVVENMYKQGYTGTGITNKYVTRAGSIETDQIVPISAYVAGDGVVQFAIYDVELNAISAKTVGMHVNDVARVNFDFSDNMIYNMSAFVYSAIGGNFSQAQVGQIVPLSITYNTTDTKVGDNTTASLLRPAVIIDKTDDMLQLKYGYEYAQIQVAQIQ